jgi:voltage-gated potassium channel
MMEKNNQNQQIVINAGYEIFILALVVFSMLNSIILLLQIQPQPKLLIQAVDIGISIILMLDFFYRLFTIKPMRVYLIDRFGWLAFLGSLPFPFMRLLRLLQMVIVWRKLRKDDFRAIGDVVVEKRAQTALLFILLMMVLVLEIGGVLVLNAEANAANANIKTAPEALWWGVVTMATVGYGDYYPVTNPGRLAGVFEMTVGVGIFTVLTSFLANWFRTPKQMVNISEGLLNRKEPVGQMAKIQEVRRLIEEQDSHYQQTLSELKGRLEELEKGIGTGD